jgi:hypothetical protein
MLPNAPTVSKPAPPTPYPAEADAGGTPGAVPESIQLGQALADRLGITGASPGQRVTIVCTVSNTDDGFITVEPTEAVLADSKNDDGNPLVREGPKIKGPADFDLDEVY